MDQNLFGIVDRYIEELFIPPDPALQAALQATVDAGIPQIQVSPGQGKLLYLLARLSGARRILEIGTLAGYSTIWLGRALPSDGRLVTLEFDPEHATVARTNLARAGLIEQVEVVVGPALETLPQLAARDEEPFDVVFIDADKINYPAYLEWAIRLTRSGGLILADNVVRGGTVLNPDDADESAVGAAAFNAALANEERVEAIVIQQVGAKSHDGLAFAVVR
jgi:predicted O-methyltransferase YrrM